MQKTTTVKLNMKTMLVFSDLHANKRAIDDIISVIQEVDLSIFCGDLLGYGKDLDSCIDFILTHVDLAVLGNHERLALTNENLEGQTPATRESALYNRRKLSTEQKKLLSSLPTEIWYKNMYITHSIDDDYLRTGEDFKKLCAKMRLETKYGFFGHTHEQILFNYNNKTIINPGSITKGRKGLPRGYVLIYGDNVKFVNLGAIL